MSTLHELEERADRHRQEALKKIKALEQEETQDVAQPSDQNSPQQHIEKIQIQRSW